MSTLAGLKLVASKKAKQATPVVLRRNKLAAKLLEQIELAQAQKEGRPYAPKRIKTLVNAETGERTTIEVNKRVKEWYWINDNGKINLSIRYGAKLLELAKGKNAIELASGDELMATLNALKTAVLAGELDAQIEAASGAVRAGFQK